MARVKERGEVQGQAKVRESGLPVMGKIMEFVLSAIANPQ